MNYRIFIILLCFLPVTLTGQKKYDQKWQLLDPQKNGISGTGSEEAYQLLKDKTPRQVIVAVIDGGADVQHEDLKGNLWVNEDEVPGNNIDDDKNGYVDDINGWSFIGGKNADVNYESSELARLFYKLKKKFAETDTSRLTSEQQKEFTYYKKIRKEFIKEFMDNEMQLSSLKIFSDFINKVKSKNNGVFSKKTLKSYEPESELEIRVKKQLKKIVFLTKMLENVGPEKLAEELSKGAEALEKKSKYNKLNTDSIRRVVVGDNPDDPNEKYYGSNNVSGPDAQHGSHVSGIIGAVRNNDIGIQGVADNVKIMVLRAVPNGDERDKDIANSIRYAVDNGAKIINMSFGKYYSPDKKVIDEAVKYAASKDVLLIHAAGNDAKNEDIEQSFPTKYMLDGTVADNWMEIGANGSKKKKNMVASFSNYGKTHVDIFAPGVNIYSTLPKNKYGSESGTSMAAPSASGVAAIIRSYFPELTALQVKDVLMKSAVHYKKKFNIPGKKKERAKLQDLCVSGGVINAAAAVRELLKSK